MCNVGEMRLSHLLFLSCLSISYTRIMFSAGEGGWVGPREKRRQGGASKGFVTGIIYLCPPRPTPVHGQSLGVHFTWEFPDCNLESDRAQVQTKFYDFKE